MLGSYLSIKKYIEEKDFLKYLDYAVNWITLVVNWLSHYWLYLLILASGLICVWAIWKTKKEFRDL